MWNGVESRWNPGGNRQKFGWAPCQRNSTWSPNGHVDSRWNDQEFIGECKVPLYQGKTHQYSSFESPTVKQSGHGNRQNYCPFEVPLPREHLNPAVDLVWKNRTAICGYQWFATSESMATEIWWPTTEIKSKPHTHTHKSIKRVSCYRTSKSRIYIYICVCGLTLGSHLNIQKSVCGK